MTTCDWCKKPKCECGKCHNCEYQGTPSSYGSPARTQKGIGLGVLRGVYPSGTLPVRAIIQKKEDLPACGIVYPIFARPCPSTPKHGYIDSRSAKSNEEVVSLLEEILADDPGGELLLCPFVDAAFNVVWTPGSMVIGPGHDGATAGKKTLTFPLAGKNPFKEDVLAKAKVSPDGWPFVEAVLSKGKEGQSSETILTQLRAGPKIEGEGDYIPALTEVVKVIKADPAKFKDRDWEILIDKEAGEKGTVVWHPGGAMTDHFSIHAFTHQIPIIFSHQPKLGEVLEPLEGHSSKTFDPQEMLKGLIVGEKLRITNYSNEKVSNVEATVKALLTILHNSTALTGENSKWIGFATAIMLRAGVTALRGEARHLSISGKSSASREAIYLASFSLSLSRHRASVNSLVNLFRYGAWHSAGFGGLKWAACGAATVELFEAVRRLAQDPSEATAAGLVRALNVAVNQAHNGGWWLNKFCNVNAFTEIQNGNLTHLIPSAGILYTGEKIYKSITKEGYSEGIKKIAKWPETNLRPPKVESVKLTYQPGIDAIGLRIRTRLLKDKSRLILAPVGKVIAALEGLVGDYTFLQETEDGFRVEVRHPTKGVFILWEDEKLADRAAGVAKTMDKKGS